MSIMLSSQIYLFIGVRDVKTTFINCSFYFTSSSSPFGRLPYGSCSHYLPFFINENNSCFRSWWFTCSCSNRFSFPLHHFYSSAKFPSNFCNRCKLPSAYILLHGSNFMFMFKKFLFPSKFFLFAHKYFFLIMKSFFFPLQL